MSLSPDRPVSAGSGTSITVSGDAASLTDAALLDAVVQMLLPSMGEPLAVVLIDHFGSLAGILAADASELSRAGASSELVRFAKFVRETCIRMAREEACQRPVVSSWSQLLAFVQVAPADAAALRPLVRLLFYAAAQSLTAHEATDALGARKRHRLLMVMDEFPLLGRLAFFEKSLRLMSGYGIKAMFVAQSLNDIVETYGPHNTLLDNCAVYTAFSALDPLTQDKVSKLTGTVLEPRTSRSSASGFARGGSSVSRSTTERPLLEPGEIRALPDDQQLVFVAGHRPLRTRKLRYDRRKPYRRRADLPPPDQAARLDGPPRQPHLWAGRRSAGQDAEAELPLFKEVRAAMDDKKVIARLKGVLGKAAAEMAAQDEVLDHLQGAHDAQN